MNVVDQPIDPWNEQPGLHDSPAEAEASHEDFKLADNEYGHQHTWGTVTKWDYYSQRYNGRLDYSVALEVMCSGCLERKALEQKETEE